MITSEWGTPNMVENGVDPELLLGGEYGHAIHVWDLRRRNICRRSTSAPSSRWCSSCGRRTTRRKAYGFVGVVVSPEGPLRLGLALVPRRRRVGRSAR